MTVDSVSDLLDREAERLLGQRGTRHALVGVGTRDDAADVIAVAGPMGPDGPPMRPDTPYHYTSVTKLYTATTVMQLWERGDLDLDAPIGDYLPADHVRGLHRLDGVDHSDAITARHLLAQTSGLPDYFLQTPPGGESFGDRIEREDFAYTLDDVVDTVRRLRPHFPPQDPSARRQRARYADTNFQLLGAVVATVTGRPYHDAVETQILQALDLDDTWFAGHPRTSSPGLPSVMWSGNVPLDRPKAMASMGPDGGLVGTATDALAFLRALVAGELFERHDTLEHMTARWNRFGLPRDRTAIMAPGWPIEYGLGIKRYRIPRLLNAGRPSPTLIGHSGASGAWLFWSPEEDLYLAGTVDQARAAPVPYRLAPRLVHRLAA